MMDRTQQVRFDQFSDQLKEDNVDEVYVTTNNEIVYTLKNDNKNTAWNVTYKTGEIPGVNLYDLLDGKDVKYSAAEELIRGIEISNRTLGFVNAPSLIQKAVARCLEEKTDVTFYDENRSRLYEGLTKLGFTCIKPEGAFYLWVKSPVENEEEFVNEGKKFNLLMVKGSAFGCPGFVRLAYCVSHETVEHSLPAFAKLAAVYGLEK